MPSCVPLASKLGPVSSPGSWPGSRCSAEPDVAPRPGPHSCFARHHAVAAAPAGELLRSTKAERRIRFLCPALLVVAAQVPSRFVRPQEAASKNEAIAEKESKR